MLLAQERYYAGPAKIGSQTRLPSDVTIRRPDGSVETVPHDFFSKQDEDYFKMRKRGNVGPMRSSHQGGKVISQSRRASTGTITTILLSGTDYVVICEEHVNRAPTARGKYEALRLARDPREWCQQCRSSWRSVPERPAAIDQPHRSPSPIVAPQSPWV